MRKSNLLQCLVLVAPLALTSAGCAVFAGRESAADYADDATITAKVKASLITELGMEDINVETMKNVVQLSGFVEDANTKTKAGALARDVYGVREVKNNIIVR